LLQTAYSALDTLCLDTVYSS